MQLAELCHTHRWLWLADAEVCIIWVFSQFKDPLIMLLLASAFISACTKQFDDAFSIAVVSRDLDFTRQ